MCLCVCGDIVSPLKSFFKAQHKKKKKKKVAQFMKIISSSCCCCVMITVDLRSHRCFSFSLVSISVVCAAQSHSSSEPKLCLHNAKKVLRLLLLLLLHYLRVSLLSARLNQQQQQHFPLLIIAFYIANVVCAFAFATFHLINFVSSFASSSSSDHVH